MFMIYPELDREFVEYAFGKENAEKCLLNKVMIMKHGLKSIQQK